MRTVAEVCADLAKRVITPRGHGRASDYPHAYAYDLMREYAEYLPVVGRGRRTRAMSASLLTRWTAETGEDRHEALALLGDTYMLLNGLTLAPELKTRRMEVIEPLRDLAPWAKEETSAAGTS